MSVNVEWRVEEGEAPPGGVVAEGTYVWDAAKRLGVRLPTECGGRGECDTCAVIVVEGATLLSTLTDSERRLLSPERLAAGERLACQAKIERGGQLVLQPVPQTERQETTEETVKDFRKEFREMPLQKKLATLFEFEAITAYQTISKIIDLPYVVAEKGLDLMAVRGRGRERREREEKRPAEHRAPTTEEPKESEG